MLLGVVWAVLILGFFWCGCGAWLLWGLFVPGLGLTSSGFRQVWFRASLIWGLLGLSQRLFLLSFKA